MKTTILAFLFPISLAAAEPSISFQKLPAGDSIHVEYTSTGCFHDVSYEFDFQRGTTFTAKVTKITTPWNEAKQVQEKTKRILLGSVDLSDKEIAGLDRLFAYYRTKKQGGCTTVDLISSTQKSGDTVKASESFTDQACGTYGMKEVTLLSSIVEKVQ